MLAPLTNAKDYLSLPTPTARDYKDTTVRMEPHRPNDTDTINRALANLLPTPTASRVDAENEQSWLEKTEQLLADDQGVKTVSLGLAVRSMKTKSELTTIAQQLTVTDNKLFDDQDSQDNTELQMNWGKYAPAIKRWEYLTRPVPEPTVERNDRRRLNPQFVEWMMGLDDGHVTSHGLSAAQELKMLGNGVVPQQARMAINQLMERAQQ